MAINRETREKAFSLYCLSVPQETIAAKLRFNHSTLSRWIKKYGWEERRNEILQFSKDNSKYSQVEQEDKVIDFMLAKGFEALKQDKVRYTARDIGETIKLRSLRRGEATENIKVDGVSLVVNYPVDYKRPKKDEIK